MASSVDCEWTKRTLNPPLSGCWGAAESAAVSCVLSFRPAPILNGVGGLFSLADWMLDGGDESRLCGCGISIELLPVRLLPFHGPRMKLVLFNLTEEVDEGGGEEDRFLNSGNLDSGASGLGLIGTCGFSLNTGAFRLSVLLRLDESVLTVIPLVVIPEVVTSEVVIPEVVIPAVVIPAVVVRVDVIPVDVIGVTETGVTVPPSSSEAASLVNEVTHSSASLSAGVGSQNEVNFSSGSSGS